jgi:hypothetical protein
MREQCKMTELAETNELVQGNAIQGSARHGQEEIRHWVQERIRRLPFRMGGQEAEFPLGTRVLVLKGEARNDLGRMAVVSGTAAAQVVISYRGSTGMIISKRKQRVSLIRMEEGVELVVTAEGWSVIRSIGMQDDTGDEHDDVGVVSADEESRAQ